MTKILIPAALILLASALLASIIAAYSASISSKQKPAAENGQYYNEVEARTMAEHMGLCTCIRSLKWRAGRLAINYRITHIYGLYHFRNYVTLYLLLWDANRAPLVVETPICKGVPESFVKGEQDWMQFELDVAIPERARYIAIEVGDFELGTRMIEIPALEPLD